MQPVSHGSRSGGLQTEAGFSRLVAVVGAAHASRATGSGKRNDSGAARLLARNESREGGEKKRRAAEAEATDEAEMGFDGVEIRILAARTTKYLVQHNWRSGRVTWPLVPP